MVVEIQLSMFNLSIGGSFFLLFFLPLSYVLCGLATVLHIGAKLLTDEQIPRLRILDFITKSSTNQIVSCLFTTYFFC